MGLFTTILGILFFGCYAIAVLIPHLTTQKIAAVVSAVAAFVIALQLLVGVF